MKDSVYATTFEPIAIVYNKRLVPAEDVPKTHADFTKLLNTKADKYQKKVTTYDAEKSGVGFMLVNQDAKLNPAFWDLVKAMGARGANMQSSTGTMMERVSSGENLIGYNILGSYALTRAKKDPSIGIAVHHRLQPRACRGSCSSPRMRRIRTPAGCGSTTCCPSAARRSPPSRPSSISVRTDMTGKDSGTAFAKELGSAVKPIAVNNDLLQGLDQTKRLAFLKQWQTTLGRK